MIDLIHNIAIVQGVITGLVLLFLKRNGKHDSKYIALFLLFLSLAIINESYGDYTGIEFHLLYPFKFFFLLPNLIFLHINSKITGANSRKTVLLNFLPGIGALLQVNLEIEIPLHDLNDQEVNKIDTNKHETDAVFIKIESFMETEHPFLNPNLNLKLLSHAMNIPERQVSNAINQNSEQNFYSYINQ